MANKLTGQLILTLGTLVIFFLGCERKAKLDTDLQKASYALGQQIGKNFKSQNVDVDVDVFAVGMQHALQGKESKMKPEEMQAAMQKLNEIVMKKQSEAAESSKKAANDFLEKNKTQANVKVTASGLQYIVEKEGEGKSPSEKDTVEVNYKGTLTNGEQFDSSYDRNKPAEIPLSSVIPAWREALPMMKVGGKMKLFVPPDLGYGDRAIPGIPANSVLVFDIELLKIKK